MAGEYIQSKKYLDNYCEKISVSLIYVIKVDTSDYGRFVSVFNSVDNSVGGTDYTPWEIGFKRDTTNDEYREKYKKVYTEEAPYQDVYRTKNLNGKLPHITTIVPVKNSAGEVVALLCVQRPISELREGTRPYLLNVTAATIILAVLASLVIAQYIKRQFIIPVGKISDEAVRFANENTKGKALGDISKITEIAGLAHSVDTMETDMLNYIDNLTAITAEKERIGAELSVARTIQENSIPNDFPAFPEIDAFDIYASMTPAKEVGGDFYNFFLIDEDRLAFVIGDVSGKGVPAALFMMVTNILISHRTR
ncbi:MAG: SpoIIE family protein phosphatase, partial [Eubacterium sp.]|nr:SpoIIE family protein phosphatase [Eubacterium sp.]